MTLQFAPFAEENNDIENESNSNYTNRKTNVTRKNRDDLNKKSSNNSLLDRIKKLQKQYIPEERKVKEEIEEDEEYLEKKLEHSLNLNDDDEDNHNFPAYPALESSSQDAYPNYPNYPNYQNQQFPEYRESSQTTLPTDLPNNFPIKLSTMINKVIIL